MEHDLDIFEAFLKKQADTLETIKYLRERREYLTSEELGTLIGLQASVCNALIEDETAA